MKWTALLSFVFLAGCAIDAPPNRNRAPRTETKPAVPSPKPWEFDPETAVLDTAPRPSSSLRSRTKLLSIGMTQAEAVAVMGEPEATEAKTFGSATAQPWPGLEWHYAEGVRLVFSNSIGEWRLNSWRIR